MPGLTILAFVVVPLVFCFLVQKRLQKYSFGVRFLCSIVAVCVVSVFQLILCEVLQTGDPGVRVWLWMVQTAIVLVLVLVINPFFLVWRLSIPRMLCPLVYAGYVGLAYTISKKIPMTELLDGSIWFSLRQQSLALVSFAGITTMSMLCGISSINAPYTVFIGDTPVTEVDAQRLKSSLESIDDMVKSKDLQVSRMKLDTTKPTSTGFASIFYGVLGAKDSRQKEVSNLEQELRALKQLRNEVHMDLLNVQQKLETNAYFCTFRGKIHRLVFALFSIYCVYRVVNTFLRIGWYMFSSADTNTSTGGPKDLLVLFFAKIIHHFVPFLDAAGWSRVIGVFTSGCVFCAALNGVLNTVYKIMRAMEKVPETSILDPLVVAQIASVYIIALATSLRFNLPEYMVAPIQRAIASPLDMTLVQRWNDVVLGTSSALMLVVLVCMHRLNTTLYDDEMGAKMA